MKHDDQPQLITDVELARIIGRSVQTIRNDRFKSQGLPYIKIGRSIRYDLSDVERFIEENRIEPK